MRFLTAGETHGKGLVTVIEGFPSNVPMEADNINKYLALRQQGYGRGGRMKIETDKAEFITGVRNKLTLGSPISIFIKNKDYDNWNKIMCPEEIEEGREVYCARPGHADLTGSIKYDHKDMRNVLERASARETAARVAAGAAAICLLEQFGITVKSHVVEIGAVKADGKYCEAALGESELRCCDAAAEQKMKAYIDKAKAEGDSVGGIFEIIISGVPAGLGSYVQWDRKLDAKLSAALMSIQAIKGVEFGIGFECARRPGSLVHDPINTDYTRATNNAGGIEGGMSNGEDIIIRAAMKPIPTLYKPLDTVNILTGEKTEASVERSDICAVPAASVVGMCAAAFVIADEFLNKYSGDSLAEIKRNYNG